jgi:hypothetical protein
MPSDFNKRADPDHVRWATRTQLHMGDQLRAESLSREIATVFFLRCYTRIPLTAFIYNLFNRAISSSDYLQRRMAGC